MLLIGNITRIVHRHVSECVKCDLDAPYEADTLEIVVDVICRVVKNDGVADIQRLHRLLLTHQRAKNANSARFTRSFVK